MRFLKYDGSDPVSKGLTHGISQLQISALRMAESTKEKAPLRFLKYDGSGRHDRLKHVSKGIVQTTRTRHLDQITDDNTINDVIATS